MGNFSIDKKMIRIIFSTYDDITNPNYGGGGAIAVHEVAKRLANNHSVSVISWNHSGIKNETIDGVRYERFGTNLVSPKLGMLLYFFMLPIVSLTKKYSVWFESFSPPFTASLLPLVIQKKLVGVAHMLTAEDMTRKYKLPFFKLIEKLLISQYKLIISTSRSLKNEIANISPKSKIAIIENDVDRVNAKPSAKNKRKILYLGRIEINQKGLDLLIKVFETIADKAKNVKLEIAGGGSKSETEILKKLIYSSRHKSRITLKGRIDRNNIRKMVRNAFCVVVPSRFETFGMSALESLAYSTPLFCFDIKGLGWIPNSVAFKSKPFNTNDMANNIINTLNNQTIAQKMTVKGSLLARKYTWKIIIEKYLSLAKKFDTTSTNKGPQYFLQSAA